MKSPTVSYISTFFNKRIFLIVFITAIVENIYCQFGNFLFSASYPEYKAWFPRYYLFAYSFIWALKFALAAFLIWVIVKYRHRFIAIKLHLRGSVNTAEQAMLTGNFKSLYFQHGRQFLWLQVLMLLLALAFYYLITALVQNSFNWQISLSRIYLCLLFGTSISFIHSNRSCFAHVVYRFLFTPATAFNISAYRIAFFALLAYTYYVTIQNSLPYIESKPREALPLIAWLIDILPISKGLYKQITLLGIVSCCFILIGLFTRFFVVLNAVLVFYIIAVPNFYGKLWHSQLPIWISWFLVLARLNGRFALDNYIFPKTKSSKLSPNHTFPIRIIWLQIGFIYFWAGYHKLWEAGFDWALSQSMINQVRLEWFEHFDKLPVFRIDLYPNTLYVAGMLTILFELLYPLLLLHNRLKYISIIGGLAMHNFIDAFMYIGFRQLQYQYVVFINYEKLFFAIKSFFNKGFTPPTLGTQHKINKPLVWLSLTILFINFAFGALRINSFPFSAYPTYTDLVGCYKTYLYFSPVDSDMNMDDIRALAQASNFRWENFSRIDYKICDRYNNEHKVDTMQLQNVWKWWTSAMPQLIDIDTLDIYAVKRSINPDSANIIISKEYLTRIYPNK